jgi:hypothetical protein
MACRREPVSSSVVGGRRPRAPRGAPGHLPGRGRRESDRVGDGPGHQEGRQRDAEDGCQRQAQDGRPLEPYQTVGLRRVLPGLEPPTKTRQVAPGRHGFGAALVAGAAKAALAIGGPLEGTRLGAAGGNPIPEGGVRSVPQRRGHHHRPSGELPCQHFPGLPQSVGIGHRLPHPIGRDAQRQHPFDPAFDQDRTGDERHRPGRSAVELEAREVGLKQGSGPIESGCELGRRQRSGDQ